MEKQKELSKAQTYIITKMKNGSRLFQSEPTWIKKNAFFLHPDGTYERSNIKVIRKLVEFGKLTVLKQHGFLTVEFNVNA